jgi:DNA-binding NarL/FixJ family response regulator
MWTGYDTEINIVNGVSHHASGFLRKTENPGRIIEAIRAVMDGGMPMDPVVVRKLVDFTHLAKDDVDKWGLTEREKDFSPLLAQGLTVEEIARRKNVSASTVRTHRDNIYRKLGIHNRVQLFRKTGQAAIE